MPLDEQKAAAFLESDDYKKLPGDQQKAVVDQMRQEAQGSISSVSAKPPLTSLKGAKSAAYTYGEKALELLPSVGGITGAVLGAPEGGPAGAVAGATIGGAAGESARQLGRRALGFPAPPTSSEAAMDIGKEAAAQGAGEVTGQVGSRVLKPIGEFFSKTAARGSRIPLLPSEAGVGGPATAKVEGFMEHALPSAGVMRDFRNKQITKASEELEKEIGNISQFKGTAEEAGNLTQDAIDRGKDRLKEEVNGAYRAIDDLTKSQTQRVATTETRPSSLVDEFGKPQTFDKRVLRKVDVGGVQPSTIEIKKTALRVMREIKQQEKLMDPMLLADTKATLQSILDAPNNVPFQAMAKSRSDLLSIGRKLDEALPGKRAGVAKLMSGQMDSAMMKAAEDSGISGLPEQVRAANAMTKEMHRKFEQHLMTSIIDSKSPEMISGYIRKGGLQEIRDLNAVLTVPQKQVMQSSVVRDLLKDSVDTGSGTLIPSKFSQRFRELGEERGREVFGKNYDNLKNLSDILGKINSKGGTGAMSSLHNWTYLAAGPTALMTLATGHPGTAVATAATLGAETVFMRKLAKAITNPAKSARVVDYLRRGLHGAPYAIYGLGKLVNDETDEESNLTPPPVPMGRPPLGQLPTEPNRSSMPPPPQQR